MLGGFGGLRNSEALLGRGGVGARWVWVSWGFQGSVWVESSEAPVCPSPLLQEEVGRWVAQQEKETRRLQRPGSARLFPLPGRGHKYAVEIRGQLNGSAGPGHSELTLLWDRTGVPGGSVSTQVPGSDPAPAPGLRCPGPQTNSLDPDLLLLDS